MTAPMRTRQEIVEGRYYGTRKHGVVVVLAVDSDPRCKVWVRKFSLPDDGLLLDQDDLRPLPSVFARTTPAK